jgi:hypothetical protein
MKYGQDTVGQVRFIMGRCNPVPASAPAADWHDTHARETYDRITAMAGTGVDDRPAPSGPVSARSPHWPAPVSGRARRVAAPVTAALAVAGVIAAITLAASSGNSPPTSPGASSGNPPPVSRAARTGSLPLLRTAARFGWLPAGEKLTSGYESDNVAYLNVTVGRDFTWDLTTWAAGYCVLDGRASEELVCQFGGGVAPMSYPVRGRADSIHGHAAFWTRSPKHREIIWEYAPGAWAALQAVYQHQPAATQLRIASGLSFGPAGGEPFRFDFQLTGVPRDWRVSTVSYGAHDGSMLASGLEVTALQRPRTQINIDTMPGGTGNADPCWSSGPDPTRHTRLRGYDVETTTNPPSVDGESDVHDLCANDVGGLSFSISTSEHAARTPTELFEHMRFLGPNPADWATYPIG